MACSLLVIFLWGYWALDRWSVEKRTLSDPTAEKTYLIFAAIVTALILPILVIKLRSVRALASRGIIVEGRVEKVRFRFRVGNHPTTVVYNVDGVDYRIRRDMEARRAQVGRKINILYDPQKPKRCDIVILE